MVDHSLLMSDFGNFSGVGFFRAFHKLNPTEIHHQQECNKRNAKGLRDATQKFSYRKF